MICNYCELIHSTDESCPLLEAARDLDSEFPNAPKSKVYQSFWAINTILFESVVKGSELRPP